MDKPFISGVFLGSRDLIALITSVNMRGSSEKLNVVLTVGDKQTFPGLFTGGISSTIVFAIFVKKIFTHWPFFGGH